ncbi:NADH-quinone oxidoreductase subunit C [Adhaeribacter radiodurans]|uniref:NADH-quinone oxidoreductase subunit C n=1 Tax=Adhaeribacter radiodurans TaxID=2745197 RepID=A0A7L7L2Z1_9BACT|nr:NADH-quinone oxidoreductase subunit C [Adhaeribacter radiodurans]QMU27167.1 NADH-quinone oxidoreductase subunit C [Adhaeribacter radiodurans]
MEPLNNQILLEHLTKKFGDALFDIWEPYGLLTLTTSRENLLPIMEYLYYHEYLQMNFLTTMCGVHYPEKQGAELGMVYHVHSLVHNVRLRIKIFFPIEDPNMPTLTNLYETANWMEREAYDFFGVIFVGHPNLIRILNVEDMTYHPLRKQYALEDGTREDKVDTFFGR